jgi:hypothetical protein
MAVFAMHAPLQVLLLENIATSVKIGPDQLPSVHKLLIEAVSSKGISSKGLMWAIAFWLSQQLLMQPWTSQMHGTCMKKSMLLSSIGVVIRHPVRGVHPVPYCCPCRHRHWTWLRSLSCM